MALFRLGGLVAVPASTRPDLLALPTRAALEAADLLDAVGVVEIDPAVSDTASTQEVFGLSMDTLANCVIPIRTPPDVWRSRGCSLSNLHRSRPMRSTASSSTSRRLENIHLTKCRPASLSS